MLPSAPPLFGKLLATFWFAGFALLAAEALFYTITMAFRARILFFALPAIAGAIAGYLLGGTIMDHRKVEGYPSAILRGICVSLAGFVIFAGLFALSLPFAENGWLRSSIGAIFLDTLMFGLLMAGPLAVVSGGIAGASLFWLASNKGL
jgi:hypothetical protein